MAMSLHLAILGIDGSGKSTITAALPAVLSAELGLRAAAVGECFRVADPDQDHLLPGFYPEGLALSARLSSRLKRIAKRLVDHRRLYPIAKLAQMLFQDHAAQVIGRRYAA